MLTGDYTFQCKKHIGLCTCNTCVKQEIQTAAAERRQRLYNAFLEIYNKRWSGQAENLAKAS